MSFTLPLPAQDPRTRCRRQAFLSRLPAALMAISTAAGNARAETAVTLPAPPFTLPYLPSISDDWTVRLGVEGAITPDFPGSKDSLFSPVPIFSVQRAGSPERFRSPRDSSSVTLFDVGQFRAGAVGRLDGGRTASTDKALRGLGKVGTTFELGGFAEYFPIDWFRTRLEVRNGFGGYSGVVGDLSADVIVPLTQRFTVSGGPRFSLKDTGATSPFFGIDAAQSLASGLPQYRVRSGSASTGIGAQLGYQLTPQWEVHSYTEYERLLGSAAASPLTKRRGSPDQLTVGIGASYSFDVKVR